METEHVPLESDTPGQTFVLRVIRFKGVGGGPRVYMQAALHAHEIPGMVALDRLIPLLEQAESEGRLASDITLVPHANPIGLAQAIVGETLGRFDLNSRVNYNRGFPAGTPETNAERAADVRLKAFLVSLAVEAEVVLDLHCDDEGPVYLYVSQDKLEDGRRLARSISAEFILYDDGDGVVSFDGEIMARWKAQGRPEDARFASTLEYRGMSDVTPEFAEHDAAGLYRHLVEIGAVCDSLEPAEATAPVIGHVDHAVLVPSPVPGAVLFDVALRDRVKRGQRLAVILPYPGADPHELRAPHDGIVMTRITARFVRRGEHVMKLLLDPGRGSGSNA